ncbi:MAG: S1C family serine protease [Myxococcota bacterium]
MLLVSVALAADPVKLAPFVVGASNRASLGIQQEDWTAELTEALVAAGSPVEETAATRLVGAVRDAACLRAVRARNCELTIAWELKAETGVLYRVVTRGVGSDGGRGDEAVREALQDAVVRLVARPRFADRTPAAAAEPPPDWTGPLTLRRCDRGALTLPADMDVALGATVVVHSGSSMGSGVLVSPDGWVLTAAHVVDESQSLTVRTRGGESGPATIVRVDRAQDLALLRTSVGHGACLPMKTGSIPPGTEVFAIGSPLGQGLEFSVSKGVISGVREVEGRRFLQTDASVNRGNSGGPLLDEKGALLGVVSWKVSGAGLEGIAFGVPADSALSRLDLAFGAQSSEVAASTGTRGASVSVGIDDVPDATRLVRPKANVAVAPLAAGLVAGVVGAGLVGGTFAWYGEAGDDPALTVEGWRAGQALNALGWGLAAGGLGLTVVPLFTSGDAGAAVVVRF